jgi:ribosomal protein S18 acetylase RimI-like enzyme
MQQAIDAADGFRRLVLGVYDGNDRAKRFYQRNGFEPIATRRFDVGGTLYDDTIFARIMTA